MKTIGIVSGMSWSSTNDKTRAASNLSTSNFNPMNSSIIPAVESDLETIYHLFEEAIQFQKINNYIGWSSYDKNFIQEDIKQGLLFKMTNSGNIVCIFSICYHDELIWRDREMGNAIYLHRLVLNRKFQGVKVFGDVLAWAMGTAREKGLQFIRMDTWANNLKLINYYTTYGFRFLENYTTLNTADLPIQHRNLNVSLLELELLE